jgi:hypothetical protein
VLAALVRYLLLLGVREEEHVGKKGKRTERKIKERKREGKKKNRKIAKSGNFRRQK